ncbi:MAG: extracellular solute-binding protein [Desulfatirhabdiaceae bacterium]
MRQVLDNVTKNEVDAGVVYATDAAIQASRIKIVVTAPSESHKPVVYPVAVVKGFKNEELAKAFIAILKSDGGMGILIRV